MIVARTRSELDDGLEALGSPEMLALVPTMGWLHEGHLSLVDRAVERTDRTVLSIFVNPTQFGPDEDFRDYPRDLERDVERARQRGVDLVFAPEHDEVVYPDGRPRVTVDPGPMGNRLCGAYRPGHFRGVLTVVSKLFGLVRPDLAVFGRKDFQQQILIRRMVSDLELGVRIDTAPIVREEDGLAVSSRNSYLSPEEREEAVSLFRGLAGARRRFRAGERNPEALLEAVRSEVEARPLVRLQYAEIVNPESLEPANPVDAGTVVAVAAFCGDTRLIDNMVME